MSDKDAIRPAMDAELAELRESLRAGGTAELVRLFGEVEACRALGTELLGRFAPTEDCRMQVRVLASTPERVEAEVSASLAGEAWTEPRTGILPRVIDAWLFIATVLMGRPSPFSKSPHTLTGGWLVVADPRGNLLSLAGIS